MKKILILQSSSRAFQPALDYLTDEYPKAEIHAVVPACTSDSTEKEGIDEMISLDDGGFKPELEQWQELAENNYDLVVVLYNDVMSTGYENVEKITFDLDPDWILGFDAAGQTVKLNYFSYPLFSFKRKLSNFLQKFTEFFKLSYLVPLFVIYILFRAIKHRARD
jgi:ADP-heptose:LPS heptosyltransferase